MARYPQRLGSNVVRLGLDVLLLRFRTRIVLTTFRAPHRLHELVTMSAVSMVQKWSLRDGGSGYVGYLSGVRFR